MPISIKRASTTTNLSTSFNFGTPVTSFVVGISYWEFQYAGNSDHHVKTIELSVATSKTTSAVNATAYATLRDDSGATIDNARSRVHLVCVAETETDDGNIAMGHLESTSGTPSSSLALPGSNLAIGLAFIRGFSIGYPGADHHLKLLELSASMLTSGASGQLLGTARMSDDSGNSCTGAISGGLVATNLTHSGLLVQQTGTLQKLGTETIDFGRTIKEAGAIIQSLRLSFSGDDHHIDTIGAGCTNCTVSGSRVVLTDPRAFMRDGSGHNQDNDVWDSHVVLAVFAVPA